jgi:hypothetical protein
LATAICQTWWALCCLLLKREWFIGNLCWISKPARLPLASFQKLLVKLSNRSNGFELGGLEKILHIQKLLVLKS